MEEMNKSELKVFLMTLLEYVKKAESLDEVINHLKSLIAEM